jgi:hypothetical protein
MIGWFMTTGPEVLGIWKAFTTSYLLKFAVIFYGLLIKTAEFYKFFELLSAFLELTSAVMGLIYPLLISLLPWRFFLVALTSCFLTKSSSCIQSILVF